jgi:hypothetical protein
VYYAPELKYSWSAIKGQIVSENENRIKVNWDEIGIGSIMIRTDNNLTHQWDTSSTRVLINPNPPKPEIREEGKYLVTKEYHTHQWYLNGKKIIGATRHYYKADKNGVYQVIVTDSNGCKSELSDPFDFILGIDDAIYNETKVITPNPATDYIEIKNVMLNEVKHPFLNVKVYDVLGVCVLTHPLAPSREGERIRLDVSGLAAGVYFVSVDGKMYKFVKL